MEKSLLDIVQPRQKYKFSAYRKESYKHLQFLLDRVREKAQHLCEESVTSGEDEKGCPFVTFQSEEVIADIQQYDSEIKIPRTSYPYPLVLASSRLVKCNL